MQAAIDYRATKAGARPRDAHGIEEAARAALAAHSHFRGRAANFDLLADEGALVVSGAVPTFYLKQLLQTILSGVEGVRRVRNHVAVINPQGVSIVPRFAHRWDMAEGRSAEPCTMNQN